MKTATTATTAKESTVETIMLDKTITFQAILEGKEQTLTVYDINHRAKYDPSHII